MLRFGIVGNPPISQEIAIALAPACSGAGWYIGTVYTDPATGFREPGSRDSGYYATREEAQDALDLLANLGEGVAGAVLRDAP